MRGINTVLQIINSALAFYILIYSGMLLASLKSFPFWYTWSLPLMFIISGLTGGIMLLILLSAILGIPAGNLIVVMTALNNPLLLILALILIFFLLRDNSIHSVNNSVHFMTEANKAEFYGGVIIAGLFIPLSLGIFLVYVSPLPSAIILPFSIVFTIFGLIGGYILKSLILKSGNSTSLHIPGETVTLPETAPISASERVHYR